MREYTKLLIVAIFASAITFGATMLFQPTPVQAAPAADALPPDFKAGMLMSFDTTTTGGKITATHGEWVKLEGEGEVWWINANNPALYFQFSKEE
jgi:hypothetical protein